MNTQRSGGLQRKLSQLFSVGQDYETRLSRLEKGPAVQVYVLRHGIGRYSKFRADRSGEGMVRATMLECVGVERERAMEYFGLAIGGRRITSYVTAEPTLNASAKIRVPENYVELIKSGVLSGMVTLGRSATNSFSYAQALGNPLNHDKREVNVETTRLGDGEILWEASADNPSDELIAKYDFMNKIALPEPKPATKKVQALR